MTPHRCPICGGNGLVSAGFYDSVDAEAVTSVAAESCQSCGGDGVVWGPEGDVIHIVQHDVEEDDDEVEESDEALSN